MSSNRLHLPRWVFASLADHFTKGLTNCYVEGNERNMETERQDSYELRIDGPYMSEVAKNQLRVYSEVNILVCTYMDATAAIRHMTNIGKAVDLFNDIVIYKYGDESGIDTKAKVELFRLLPMGETDRIQVSNFGQIEPSYKLLQASVEGHYKMLIAKE